MRKLLLTRTPLLSKSVLVLVLFIFLTHYYFRSLNAHIFHIDEYHFTGVSYYFDLLFIKNDLQDERWYIKGAPDQPKLGPYIYGITLHLAGIDDLDAYFQDVGFNEVEKGKRPWWRIWWGKKLEDLPDDLVPILKPVWLARKPAVLFTIGALFILFLLASKIKGILFGSVASFLLGINSLMFAYGRRAMTDSMQLFFFFANLLLVLFFIKAFEEKDRKKTLLFSLALGVNCSLGLGVKVSGLLIFIFLTALFSVLYLLHRTSKQQVTLLLSSFILMSISFFVVFTAFHPFLYENPFSRFIYMFTNRLKIASGYYWDIYPTLAVHNPQGAAELVFKRALLPGGGFINFKLGNLPIDLILFILGFGLMAKSALNKLYSSKKISGELILSAWTVTVIVGLIFYLRNNWPRYFLPTVAAITVTQAYAIYHFIRKYLNVFK